MWGFCIKWLFDVVSIVCALFILLVSMGFATMFSRRMSLSPVVLWALKRDIFCYIFMHA